MLAGVQGGLIGRLNKRLGEARLVTYGAVLLTIGLIALPFSLGIATILIVMALLAFGLAILNPAVTSLVSREAGTTERGGILGVNQSGQSLARILGPLIAGLAYSAAGSAAPYYIGAIIMAGVVAMATKLPHQEKTGGETTH